MGGRKRPTDRDREPAYVRACFSSSVVVVVAAAAAAGVCVCVCVCV